MPENRLQLSRRRALWLAAAGALELPRVAAGAAAGLTGTVAPDFELPARGNGRFSLAKQRGRVVMINFWATWCGPCRKEMPLLEDIHRRYGPRGFTLVGVNVEPDPQEAEQWLTKNVSVTFPIAWDTESKVSRLYQVAGMPSSVIVDRKGKVRYIHKGFKPGDENTYLDHIRLLVKE